MSEDPTSQANFLQATSEHIDFEWTVDFDKKVISGSATHTVLIKEDDVKEVVFDTFALNISKIEVDGSEVHLPPPECEHPIMGTALRVPLTSSPTKNSRITVKTIYQTTGRGKALQWLEKEQTQGKQYPYLFSQCQPIYMRSLAPVQDTPSVKTTYSSKVSSVLPVLMSAVRQSPPEDIRHGGKVVGKDVVTYVYDQPVPIPSYLIAIAVGNVTHMPFDSVEGKDWKTGIWAEPESVQAAYDEFKDDTNKFLVEEEKILPPYRFKVFDMLVLPPSFPYGGMENACCTFLTPTIVVGDRSLVDVVVHEMTHSWFGNGVTHANASHFWLNEGFTTYTERLLQSRIHSPAERDFEFIIGFKGLKTALESFENTPKYQRLVIPFDKGEDPDAAYSEVPYEKGANFLLHLERTLGGVDVFLPYLYDYAQTYTGKSITTDIWKKHLYDYFTAHGGQDKIDALNSVKWDEWLNGEGTSLPDEIKYNTELAEKAYDLAKRWDSSRTTDPTHEFHASDVNDFNSNQKVVFLQSMHDYNAFPATHIDLVGSLYQFFNSSNAEIRLVYYLFAFKNSSSASAKKYAPEALKWVVGTDGSGVIKGRMKFCRPIFQETHKIVPKLACCTWKQHRSEFHPIAQKLIDQDLGLA